jgi:hypothetical protein
MFLGLFFILDLGGVGELVDLIVRGKRGSFLLFFN